MIQTVYRIKKKSDGVLLKRQNINRAAAAESHIVRKCAQGNTLVHDATEECVYLFCLFR